MLYEFSQRGSKHTSKKGKLIVRKFFIIILFVSIIGACLEIDNRGVLPAPTSWEGKIPPPRIEPLEVLDKDVVNGAYDAAPKSIPIDFERPPFE